jgi:hypothetical protein
MPIRRKKAVPFLQQSEEVQSTLLQGVAQRINTLSYPKLSLVQRMFDSIGLHLVTAQAAEHSAEAIDTEVDKLSEEVEAIAIKAEKAEDALNKVKMVLVNGTLTLSEKVITISQIVNHPE